jgi:hypothetical protein
VEIACEESSMDEAGLEEEGRMSGTQLLSECTTFLNEKASAPCDVTKEPISMPFKGQAFEHGKAGYVLISPAEGSTFTTIALSEECSLGEKLTLTGAFALEDCNGDFSTYLVRHLLQQATGALFASGEHVNSLKLGGAATTFTGSDWYKLPTGREWKWMA